MAQLFIRHKVKDYAKWKPLFDEHGAKRKAAASTLDRTKYSKLKACPLFPQ